MHCEVKYPSLVELVDMSKYPQKYCLIMLTPENSLLPSTHTTELSVNCSGLFGQVITDVDTLSSHIPMLRRLKDLRLNSKSNTLHTHKL